MEAYTQHGFSLHGESTKVLRGRAKISLHNNLLSSMPFSIIAIIIGRRDF